MTQILSLLDLQLSNYRNFDNITLKFNQGPVVITGPNGVGKTNILEAISLLSPGKGLRNAKLSDIVREGVGNPWELYAFVNGSFSPCEISIIHYPSTQIREKREIIINGEKIKSNNELTKIFGVIWLTPQMDGLFIAASSDRRKFFDRLVYNFNSDHASRVAKYEYYMRERNSILKNSSHDSSWLTIIEEKMSQAAVAIASSRVEASQYLQIAIDESMSKFPKIHIEIEGVLEKLIASMPATLLEKHYMEILRTNRSIDKNTGRTTVGPHRTDMVVTHLGKNQKAKYCSTGEQKSLLISLILADVKAKMKWSKITPVVLLDEVTVHLDEFRKNELFKELLSMNCQFWITGIEESDFTELKNIAQFISIS